ncbi:hypothetical protein D3C75_939820 [compost metagenome]
MKIGEALIPQTVNHRFLRVVVEPQFHMNDSSRSPEYPQRNPPGSFTRKPALTRENQPFFQGSIIDRNGRPEQKVREVSNGQTAFGQVPVAMIRHVFVQQHESPLQQQPDQRGPGSKPPDLLQAP